MMMSSHKKNKTRMRLRSQGSRSPSVASAATSPRSQADASPQDANKEMQSILDDISSLQGSLGALQLRVINLQTGRASPSGGATPDASPGRVTTKTTPARTSNPGPVNNGLPDKVLQQLYFSAKPTEEEPTVWLQRLLYTLRQYNVERMNYPKEFSLCLKDDAFVWAMKFWEDNKDTLDMQGVQERIDSIKAAFLERFAPNFHKKLLDKFVGHQRLRQTNFSNLEEYLDAFEKHATQLSLLDPKQRIPPDALGRTLISGLHHSHAGSISSHVLYDTSYDHVMKLLRNLATMVSKKVPRYQVDRSSTGERPPLRIGAPQESGVAQDAHAYMARWSETAADDGDIPDELDVDKPPDPYTWQFGHNRLLSPSTLTMLYNDSIFPPGHRQVNQKKFNAALYNARARALESAAPSFTYGGHTFNLD
mmetsp:Transcript_28550/g.71868  ORF Transcript_28550/g.71868 Transcript_28550/m.71868 type:complete len:421 (+) Transcript_28550:148-1410(+)